MGIVPCAIQTRLPKTHVTGTGGNSWKLNPATFEVQELLPLGLVRSQDAAVVYHFTLDALGLTAYLPDQGTRAKVISVFKRGGPQNDGRLVEILEGKYRGKQGYITYRCLAKP